MILLAVMASKKIGWKLENCKRLGKLGDLDLEKLKRLFLSIDINGKGKISIYGLAEVLNDSSLQLSEDAIAAYINDFHCKHTGSEGMDISEFLDKVEVENVSNRELKELMHRAMILHSSIRKDFVKWDIDGENYIYTSEFKIVMRKQNVGVTEGEINAMIKDADYNVNGKIHYDELALLMTE
jgi:calcium-dependent protein kinase